MVESSVRVIYGDTDQMGVVYYANYLRYFELGRSEYFRAKGGTYRDLEAEGLLLPVVEVTCQYKASARYDDVLRVRTTIESLKRASLVFHYEIRKEGTDAILCTGRTVHASVGRDGKMTRLPEKVIALLQPEAQRRDT